MNWAATLRGHFPSTDPLILGVYAWALTVAAPSLEADWSISSGVASALSPVSLIAGWAMLRRLPRLADLLGTLGFGGMSAWTLLTLGPQSLDFGAPIVRLTMGAIIWSLFAIAWARARHLPVLSAYPAIAVAIPDVSTSDHSSSLRSRFALSLGGVLCAALVALSGTPRSDGHGVLIAGLIVVASLQFTTAGSTLLARAERARAERHSKAQPAP